MALFGQAAPAPASTSGDISKDFAIEETPTDSVSDLKFNPVANYLAVASWDSKVYIYEYNPSTGVKSKWYFNCKAPVLGIAWSTIGTRLAAGNATGSMFIVDLASNPPNGELTPAELKGHDQAIKTLRWFDIGTKEYLATGSWDKTVKMWDLENPTPTATIQCADRVYTMDVCKSKSGDGKHLMVIGTAERQIHMVNLNADPSHIMKTIPSPLKWQTRVVSCFTDASGFAVGSIEGRCAIQYVEEKDTSLNFSFKCHRQQDPNQRDIAKVYSVNAISFHPQHGTFSTAGSDGTFHFWDKDAKHRLKGYPDTGGSITATDFSRDGNYFAYAISYDWSKGYAANTPALPIQIKIHPITGDECKPRPGAKKR